MASGKWCPLIRKDCVEHMHFTPMLWDIILILTGSR